MPADTPPHPVSAVPRRLRLMTALMAGALVVAMTVVAVLLKSSTTGVVSFHTSDQVAMVGLGLAMGAGVLLVGRSRVDADAEGIRVRNVVINHELPWSAVRAVRFTEHSPWATLRADQRRRAGRVRRPGGGRGPALVAVRGLRALLADHQARHPVVA